MKNKYDTIRQMIKTNGEQESSMPVSIFLFIDFSSYKCTLQEVLGVLCISVAYNLRDNSVLQHCCQCTGNISIILSIGRYRKEFVIL